MVSKWKSPVTNAFCNWPLSPVFQGPMFVPPFLRHTNSTTAATVRRKAPAGSTYTYFHFFKPSLNVCWLSVGFSWEVRVGAECCWGSWMESSEGEDAGGGDNSFLSFPWGDFGEAGKEPLPNDGIVGSSSGGAPDAGAAARLLPFWSSIRRPGFKTSCTFSSICGSAKPPN